MTGWGRIRGPLGELAGLVWRDDCVACAAVLTAQPARPGLPLCRDCALELRSVPVRVPSGAGASALPVFSAGSYGGAHRGVVLAAKEHLRAGAVTVAGAVLAGVVRHLVAEGTLPDPRLAPLVLLPAPTTARAARDRGGCVVRRAAEVAARQLGEGGARVDVVAAAQLADAAQDSVGLGRRERQANLARHLQVDPVALQDAVRTLRVPGAAACIVDDVTTSGATLSRFAAALAVRGVAVSAAVVVAHA